MESLNYLPPLPSNPEKCPYGFTLPLTTGETVARDYDPLDCSPHLFTGKLLAFLRDKWGDEQPLALLAKEEQELAEVYDFRILEVRTEFAAIRLADKAGFWYSHIGCMEAISPEDDYYFPRELKSRFTAEEWDSARQLFALGVVYLRGAK